MIRRRDIILRKLRKKSYTTKQLAEEIGVSQPTIRKHIELLRKEGHNISYNRRDKRYYTLNGVTSMRRTENKLKQFIAQWIGSPAREQDQEAINRIYRALGDGAAELEEKAAQLVLRYIITHHTQEPQLSLEAIQKSLGLELELVQKVLGRLVREAIVAKKEYGENLFYDFEEDGTGFIRATNKGCMTIATSELEELFTIKESSQGPTTGGINSVAMYISAGKKIYRWIPYTVPGFLIPGIFNAFTTSFSQQSYEAMNGSRFSGHGFWEYMPPIIRYQQGLPRPQAPPTEQVAAAKVKDIGPEMMTSPEDHLVKELTSQQRPDPFLYSLLGFGETTTARQLSKATRTIESSRMRSLLAYHKPLYEKIKADGVAGLETEIERMQSLHEEDTGDCEFFVLRAKPSSWLTSAYLTIVGKTFEYAASLAGAEGLKKYAPSLRDYSDIFLRTGKELEARQSREETGIAEQKTYVPLKYEVSAGGIDPTKARLDLRVDRVMGTSNNVGPGECFVVKGRYTLESPEIKSLCVACHGASRGGMAYLSPGSGEFDTWGEIINFMPGHEKDLDLLIFDKERELGSITKIHLR